MKHRKILIQSEAVKLDSDEWAWRTRLGRQVYWRSYVIPADNAECEAGLDYAWAFMEKERQLLLAKSKKDKKTDWKLDTTYALIRTLKPIKSLWLTTASSL